MNRRKSRAAWIAAILLFANALILIPMPIQAQEEVVTMTGYRMSTSPKGFRVVIDLSGPAEYTVQSLEDSSRIFINLYDAQLAPNFKPVKLPKDPLLKNCEAGEPNFRQVTMELEMAYGVPADNVKVLALQNPNRLTIDVKRDYRKVQQFHLTKNIAWMQLEQAAGGRFSLVNELFVNHRSPEVTVDVEMAKGKGNRETVDSMVKRTGAVAGINAGYFSNDGVSQGLVVKEGKILASSVKRRPPRTAFGIGPQGAVFFEKLVDKDGKLFNALNKSVQNVILAVGGGPRLITKGKADITADEEGLGKGGNDITRRAGRTALGINRQGQMVLTTVSSFRSNHNDGVFLTELVQYLLSRNIVNAINFDGGGSANMAVLGTPVSQPPMGGTYRRPVTNGIMIYDKSPVISPYTIRCEPDEITLPADGEAKVPVNIYVTDRDGKPVPNGTIVSVASGYGAFTQRYHPTKHGLITVTARSVRAAGNYSVRIDCGPARTYLPVRLLPGRPKYLTKQAKDITVVETNGVGGSTGNRQLTAIREKKFIIEALLRDEYKNAVGGKTITFSLVEGQGTFSGEQCLTRKNGVADTAFTLKSPRAKIQISASDVDPIICEVAW